MIIRINERNLFVEMSMVKIISENLFLQNILKEQKTIQSVNGLFTRFSDYRDSDNRK